MSRFYGSVQGERGMATRTGHRQIHASAQSYNGSLSILLRLEEESTGSTTMVYIIVGDGSTRGGRTLWKGPISSLLNASRLTVTSLTETTCNLCGSDINLIRDGCCCRKCATGTPF